ncbi:MAG TPA: DUF499 domain-containing protein [Chloroflexia bacterium]|nr:DUF499 domain-containing protein [Chloroflexia bacterium]
MTQQAQLQLTPWRDVIAPHPDVQAGRYHQAEFAADLAQVISGEASKEYSDPVEFFRRTYLTGGMKSLLVSALERLKGDGTAPVIQLKTAFGGGKTHTMLALYHLVKNPQKAASVEPVAELLKAVGEIPNAQVAVLVGTALDPYRPSRILPEGVEVYTLWGEMAYQLGGFQGLQLVAEADAYGAAPGANSLVELFRKVGPCVILIDELVAFIRNIKGARGKPRAGDFNSNLTFIQNLTEAVKRVPTALLVASIPESRIELGDEAGEEVARRIENTFGRLETVWQPVAAAESFEVVRRRLFGELTDEAVCRTTVEAFGRLYRENRGDFPAECREVAYEEKIRSSYPIHPEIFDRLYEDWSVMERFQRTRGVLRLMANTIHALWKSGNRDPLIMPGSLPLHDARVREEMTRYLGDQWNAVVDGDVDGNNASSTEIDQSAPRFGQVEAARRLARTIFLGSVPVKGTRGIEDVRIKLGTVQPGQSISVYVDALNRLKEQLTHLYGSGMGRYWFDVQPNLNRTVTDRSSKLDAADVLHEIAERLKFWKDKGAFTGVHPLPRDPGDVPDEDRARLVLLGIDKPHRANDKTSEAIKEAERLLASRGATPRRYRNMLLFLAADHERAATLQTETRRYLAWKSIVQDGPALNLDKNQEKQAQEALRQADNSVKAQLDDAYVWLLTPVQEINEDLEVESLTWEADRVLGSNSSTTDTAIQRASQRVVQDEKVITKWSPLLLKIELDRFLWKDAPEHVSVKQIWQQLATYNYLPRLQNSDVFTETVRNGASSQDFFGYANGVDKDGHYQNFHFGRIPASVYVDENSVLIKPETAQRIKAAMEAAATATSGSTSPASSGSYPQGQADSNSKLNGNRGVSSVNEGRGTQAYNTGTRNGAGAGESAGPTRFYGSVELNALRLGANASQVASEIIQHLTSLLGADVKITLEIEANIPTGVPTKIVTTITENAKALKFKEAEFEHE